MSLGIANPTPICTLFWTCTEELTPITSPDELRRGPPELPGLSAASVCTMLGIGLDPPRWPGLLGRLLPIPLTTPTLIEFKFKNGLPIAIASWPTSTDFDSAKGRLVNSSTELGSTLIRARSSWGLEPSVIAGITCPFDRRTLIVEASLTT